MKSIGFRSSIVTLDDGANLIVPNGDLLNQHMINWSLSENKKKGVIPVSVGYGSDLVKVREILEQVAAENERVLKAPPPVALARRFGPNAVEFELIFWVIHPYDASPALSEIIAAIDQRFRKENIEIPLPRQEVHICPATAPRDKRDEEAD